MQKVVDLVKSSRTDKYVNYIDKSNHNPMKNKSSNKTKATNLGLGTKIRDKFANEDKSREIENIGLIKYNDRKDFLEAIVEASKEYQLIQHFKVAFDIDEELTEGKNIRIIIFSEDKEFFFFNNFGKIIFQEASGSDDCACFSMRWSFACPEYFNGDKDDFVKRICSAYSRFEANSREIKNILEFIERKLAQAFPENSLVLSLKESSSSLGLNTKVRSKFEKTDKGEFVEDLGNAFYDREDFISRLVDKVESLDISKSRGIYHHISNKPAEKQTYVRFEDKKFIFCTLGFRIYKDRDLFIASWGRNTSRTKPILRGEDSVILEGGRFVCNELTENNIKSFVKWFSYNLTDALTLGENNVSLGLNKKIQKKYQDKDSVSDLSCVHSIDEAVKCFRRFVDHKMREDVDIEERDLSYSGIGKRVEYNATGLLRIVLVVREWDDRPGFTIHLAGPKRFSEKEKKNILKSPLLDNYICNKKKMDTIPHQGPLFQDPIDPFSFKVEVIEEIAKFFLSCIPKKFKREAVSESTVGLGLANKVQKKFSEENPVDNLETKIETEKFIKLCKERFSKVRGIKNVEVGIDNDFGTILYIYPKDNLSRTIRKREIDGKNLGISTIFLRIEDNKFGLEFDRECIKFKKVKSYTLCFGVGEIPWTPALPENLKDKALFDLNYKNLDNAAKWLEAELKRIFSEDELKESNTSLGLNNKVKKIYSKKSTSEVSEELDTLSIDAFEKIFKDEVESLEFNDFPGMRIKVERDSKYGVSVLSFVNTSGLISYSDTKTSHCGFLHFYVDENSGEILFTFWMFIRYKDSIRIQKKSDLTDESGDYELPLKASNLHKVIDFIKKFIHDNKKDIKERLIVNESELGLNKKIQKKHSEKDAVDNISTLRPYDFRKFAQDWMSSNFVIDDKYIFSRSEEGYTRMAVDFTIPGVKKKVDDGEIVSEEYRTPVLIDYFFLKKEGESNYACKIKLYVYLKKKSFSFCMAVYNNIVIKEHGYIPSMSYPLTIGVFTEKMQELLKEVKKKDSLCETSSLGLNKKIQKKFDFDSPADAIDIDMNPDDFKKILEEYLVRDLKDKELKDKTYNLSVEKKSHTYATTGDHEYIIIRFGIKNSYTNPISFGITFVNDKTMPEKANHAYYIERVYYQNPRGFLVYGLGYRNTGYDNIFNDLIFNSEPNGYYIVSTSVAADRISKWIVNKICTFIEERGADRRVRGMNESDLGLNKKVQRKFKEKDKVEDLGKLDTDTFMKLFIEKAEKMKFEGFPNLSIKTKSDSINAVKIYLCNDSVGYRCRTGNLMVDDDSSCVVWVVCRLENNFLGTRHRELEILDYKSLEEALEFIKENILKYKDSIYPKAFVNESVNLGLNNKVKKRFENRNAEKEVGTMFSEFTTVEEFLDKFIEIVESYDIDGKHICFRRNPIYGDRSYFYNGDLGGNKNIILAYIEYKPETDSSGIIRGWLSSTSYKSPGKNLEDYIQFGKFIFKDNDKESNEKAHDIIDFVTEILEEKYHATMTISESNLGLNSKVKEKFSSTSVEDVVEDLASMSKEDFLKEMRLEMTKITNYAGFITFNSNDPAVLPFKDEVFFDEFYPNGRNEKGWGHFQIFRKTPNHGERQILNLLILDQDVSRTNYPVFSCWVNWKRKDETTYYYSSKYKDFISDSDIDKVRFIEDTGIRKNRLTAYNITTLSEKIKEFFKKKYEKDFENKRKEMSRT